MSTYPANTIDCEFCGHEGSRLRFDFGDTKIFFCRSCRASFTFPKPTETSLNEIYNDGYFSNEKITSGDVNHTYGYQSYEDTKEANIGEYQRICGQLGRFFDGNLTGKRLLDYGCGLGTFLSVADQAGFVVEGLEFNTFAAKSVAKKYGFKIYGSDGLRRIKKAGKLYDVISLFDVFEHLLDPRSVIREIYQVLAKDGLLLVGTTDFNHIIPRLLGKRFEDFRRIREHIYFFGKKDLVALLAMQGFTKLKLESQHIRLRLQELTARMQGMGIPGAKLLAKLTDNPYTRSISIEVNYGMKYIAYFRRKELTHYAKQQQQALPLPIRLSVVIPVFNEEKTIEQVIDRVLGVKLAGVKLDLVVVDDGSTDTSRMLLENLQTERDFRLFLSPRNQGKGSAIREGIKQADGAIVIIQDADLEYEPDDYGRLIAPIIAGDADAVYGSRFLSPERKVMGFWHTYGNKFLTFICNMVVNLNVTDMETCYKVMKTEVAKSLNLRSQRFDIEPEITCKLARAKLRIYEVPIKYHARSVKQGKKIGIKDLFQALWAISKYGILRLK